MSDSPRIGGIVLAAGAGRRFGSPKQLAELDGKPLIQHAVDAIVAVPSVSPIVVVLGAEASRVRAGLSPGRARIVECPDWSEGMAASLRCGLAALGDCDWAVLCLGDQPLIGERAIELVVSAATDAASGTEAVRAHYDGSPGHPVALSRSLFPSLSRLSGDLGAREILEVASVEAVEAGTLGSPVDVDTRQQLASLGP